MLRPGLLAAPLVALLAASPAVAKKPAKVAQAEAREHFTSGMAHYNLEHYEQAIKEFEAAYLIVPDPTFLYNLGQCYRKSNRAAKAIDYYKRYLNGTTDAPNRAEVEELVKELEVSLKPPPAPAPPPPPPKPVLPKATPVVDKDTQTAYLNYLVEEDHLYTLIGVGNRKVYGFKVYGMGMYVEDVPARAAFPKLASLAGGRDLGHLTAADVSQTFILLGDFGKIGVLRFVRDVKGKDVQDAYLESINEELKSQTPELKRAVAAFIKLFAPDVKEGDECVIRSSARGDISVEIAGKRQKGPSDAILAQAIWNIWLGKRPISPDLRKALVNRIDLLGK